MDKDTKLRQKYIENITNPTTQREDFTDNGHVSVVTWETALFKILEQKFIKNTHPKIWYMFGKKYL